ncbi:MAG: isoprenylcysteine carboxylmethyltransferase family protein [Bacteroidota bacterium]|nr:isoprenylcysteine carboxylmethyltransferase family protein [Bacteroidota bacterium]
MNYLNTEKLMWLAITIYWLVTALFVKRTLKRQPAAERLAYILCVLLAFSLLFENYFPYSFLYQPLFLQNAIWKVAGLILCAAGLIFSLTARIYLGENWSGTITVKENHQLIQSGPYRITRNPIYTGFLLAFLGCAMSLGEVKGWIGIIFLLIAILLKVRKEEAFMQETFGDLFQSYKLKVKRLVPGLY